jgi:hypothetical protein
MFVMLTMPLMTLLLTVIACLLPSYHAWSLPMQSVAKISLPQSRRDTIATLLTSVTLIGSSASALPVAVLAEDILDAPPLSEVEVVASGAAKSIFNEGRAYEMQGNMAAAQRLYVKTTKISPRVRNSSCCWFLLPFYCEMHHSFFLVCTF